MPLADFYVANPLALETDDTYNDRTRQLTIKLGDKFGGRSVQLERMTGLIVTPLSH